MNNHIKKASIYLALIMLFSMSAGNVFAQIGPAQKVRVTASVEPQRTVVVNENFQIISIVSNTSKEVEPKVFLNTVDGKELEYTETIKDEYDILKETLSFAKPGVIYEYKEVTGKNVFTTSALKIAKLLNFSI